MPPASKGHLESWHSGIIAVDVNGFMVLRDCNYKSNMNVMLNTILPECPHQRCTQAPQHRQDATG